MPLPLFLTEGCVNPLMTLPVPDGTNRASPTAPSSSCGATRPPAGSGAATPLVQAHRLARPDEPGRVASQAPRGDAPEALEEGLGRRVRGVHAVEGRARPPRVEPAARGRPHFSQRSDVAALPVRRDYRARQRAAGHRPPRLRGAHLPAAGRDRHGVAPGVDHGRHAHLIGARAACGPVAPAAARGAGRGRCGRSSCLPPSASRPFRTVRGQPHHGQAPRGSSPGSAGVSSRSSGFIVLTIAPYPNPSSMSAPLSGLRFDSRIAGRADRNAISGLTQTSPIPRSQEYEWLLSLPHSL